MQTLPHQNATLLPKGAPRSDTVQMTAIASSYDPTPARRAPNKHVTFVAVCCQQTYFVHASLSSASYF